MKPPDLDLLEHSIIPPQAADPDLSPFGSAKERFLAERPDPPGRAVNAKFLSWLRQRARAQDLPHELIDLAWGLSELERHPDPRHQQATCYLVLAMLLALREGSTRMYMAPPEGRAHLMATLKNLLPPDPDPVLDIIASRENASSPSPLIGHQPQEYKPLVRDGPYLYAQRMWQFEDRLTRRLHARMIHAPADPSEVKTALSDVLHHPPMIDDHPIALSEEQVQAVVQAASQRWTVVSGGPGTGKTSIVLALLRVLIRLGVQVSDIALTAPTGKAAQRMAEAVSEGLARLNHPGPLDTALTHAPPVPKTLHRLLGYRPGADTFTHHEDNPLAESVVIVDEGSMVDLGLMQHLLSSVRPDARMVVLGDIDQLPSVNAGNVLRQLRKVDHEPRRWTVELSHSYRMRQDESGGRQLLEAARCINEGNADALLSSTKEPPLLQTTPDPKALSWQGLALLTGEDPAAVTRAFIEQWEAHLDPIPSQGRIYRFFEGRFRPEDEAQLTQRFDTQNRRKLLCVTRSTGFVMGANTINQRVHQRRAAAQGQYEATDPLPGEPVMMLKNDYVRNLFNGDVGIIMKVAVDRQPALPMAVFSTPNGFQPFHLNALQSELTLAHAMTIHKAQGSEFDHVAIFLPEYDLPLLTREILYTAVTRAKKSVTFVGHLELIRRGIERAVQRDSGIAEKLSSLLLGETA